MTTIIDKFWHLKDELHDMMVTATLRKDVDAVEKVLSAGTRVRIVMMSRFGDVGITEHLEQTSYRARVGGHEKELRNPGEAEDLFSDITGMDEDDLLDICLHVHGGYVDVVRDTRDNTWSVITKNCLHLHDGITNREEARRVAEAHIDSEYAYWSPKRNN